MNVITPQSAHRTMQRILFCSALLAAMATTSAHAASTEAAPVNDSMFGKVDTNHDGMVSAEEFKASGMDGKLFGKADDNHDGMLNQYEFIKAETPAADK